MIETTRLVIRAWEDDDVEEFIRVTNTPAVMEHLGGVFPPDDFRSIVPRIRAGQSENGFSFWILRRKSDDALLGFCGLKVGNVGPKVGEIEVGWRIREDAWGQGYAREAASAVISWGWRNLACKRMIASTVEANTRSWRLMEALGMTRQPDLAYDAPSFPVGHPTRSHIIYTIDRPLNDPSEFS